MSAGLVSPEAVREFEASALTSGGLLAIFGVPWPLLIFTFTRPSRVCVCLQIYPLYNDTSHIELGPHLNYLQ